MSEPQRPAHPAEPQPPYPHRPNPYETSAPAPLPGGGSMQPGTIGYVQAHFGEVAGFGERALALVIDTLVVLVAMLPMVIGIVLIAVGASASDVGDGSGETIAGLIVVLLSILLAVGVSIWNRILRMGRTGQSIGKQQMGLVLIDARTGAPIGPGRCFLRELLSGLVNQVFYLSYLWMLWDGNRQTLADLVMTSTVIKRPRA